MRSGALVPLGRVLFARSRASLFALSLVAGVGLVGCNDDGLAGLPTSAMPAPPSNTGKHIGAISFATEMRGEIAPTPIFVIRELVDLALEVKWQGPSTNGRSTRLRFYAPNGRLFSERKVSETGGDVWTTLPVGGTLISRRSLRGIWRAEAELDDGSTATAPFVLEP